MSLSNNPAVYADCFAYFERAMDAERGISITFASSTDARAFAARLNKARVLDRRRRMKVLDTADPTYGHSDYDHLRVRITNSTVEILRYAAPTHEVREL